MESFIVRIYYRDREAGERVVGQVVEASSGRELAFSTPEELWTILTGAPENAEIEVSAGQA